MKVEKVSFSYKGIKPHDNIALEHPFLYTSNFKHKPVNKHKYTLFTILGACAAVVVTLINLRKKI